MRRSRSAARNAALLRGGLELGRSYNRSSNAKVSAAGIRLNSRKIYRAFKGIICGDISEFESYMGSHTVRLCGSCVTCEEMRDSLIVPSRRRRMTANVRAERLLKIPAEPSPELRIPGAAAQTRVVSMAGIRLDSPQICATFQRDNLRRHF